MAAPSLLRPPEEPRDPQTRRSLRHIAGLLVGPDESARRRALAVVAGPMAPVVRASVIAELLEVLHAGHAPSCRHAEDALAAVGPAAEPALVHALRQGGGAAWLLRLARAPGRVAPDVPAEEQPRLLLELSALMFGTPHDAVASALIRVMAPLAATKPTVACGE